MSKNNGLMAHVITKKQYADKVISFNNDNDIVNTDISKRRYIHTSTGFSLVEAMIILVLISIAIMVLIPLLSQQSTVPHWQNMKDSNGNQHIAVGANDDTRVGIGINPYERGSEGKFATNTLSIFNGIRNLGTADTGILLGEIYSIQTDSFSREQYPTRSIRVGMNVCQVDNPPTDSVVIRSNPETDYSCDPAGVTMVNINDRILVYDGVQNDNATATQISMGTLRIHRRQNNYIDVITGNNIFNDPAAAGTLYNNFGEDKSLSTAPRVNANIATDAIFTIKYDTASSKDIFRINQPELRDGHTNVGAEVLAFNGTTLHVASNLNSTMVVNGMLTLSDTDYDFHGISKDATSSTGFQTGNIKCDYIDGIEECGDAEKVSADCCKNVAAEEEGDPNRCKFRMVPDEGGAEYCYNEAITTDANKEILGRLLLNTPSDARLKNILEPYVKGTSELAKVETYNFTYKNDKSQMTFVGIIAQKLIGLFDIALHKDEKGYYSYERTPLLYAMTNAAGEIDQRQKNIAEKQKQMSADADKLIRMYK